MKKQDKTALMLKHKTMDVYSGHAGKESSNDSTPRH